MEKETETKWKCKVCDRTLASKQTALKHVKRFHDGSKPGDTITKVKVAKSEKPPKPVAKEKRKAYSFFSGLGNMFNDESKFESFSWSKPKAANPSETVASTSLGAVSGTGPGLGSSQLSSSATSPPTQAQSNSNSPVSQPADDLVRTLVMMTTQPEHQHSTQLHNTDSSPAILAANKNTPTMVNARCDTLSSSLCDIGSSVPDGSLLEHIQHSKSMPERQNSVENLSVISECSSVPMSVARSPHMASVQIPLSQSIECLNSGNTLNINSESEFHGIEINSMEIVPDIGDIDFTKENDTFNYLFREQDQSIPNIVSSHFMVPAFEDENVAFFTADQEGANLVTSSSINIVSDITEQILPLLANNNVAVGPTATSLPPPGGIVSMPGSSTGLTIHHKPGPGLSAQSRVGHSAGISPATQPQHTPGSKPGPGFKVPYKKVRGHCGSQECVGCNREPCQTCYNCLHKKETR